ncbi:hypothetical protein ETD86_04790 [Nonomuraea turkmeniaca]|uniref:Uncharacterized protein n=1 Tax=Nonomuraea turkmeniaca TaxID=103838 RepID=A0A5S4FUT1_9ACTN|nr:hypothetical protein [Nonomuraea turkmeniaca]TMR24449.1 hypothetical protein ETD86_04790 [Nonomuraea turkmeniaca]
MASEMVESPVRADRAGQAVPGFADRLAATLEQGYRRAMVVSLARRVAALLPGARANWFTASVSVLAMASWPYLADLVLVFVAPDQVFGSVRSTLYVMSTTVVCVVMLALAWSAWRHAEKLVAPLSDLVADSPERDQLIGWLRRRMRVPGQLLCALAGAAVSTGMLVLTALQPGDVVEPNAAVYLHNCWMGFLGGNTLYWLITVADLPLRLRTYTQLRLAWIDPAGTFAIVRLCHCYALVSMAMAVGVVSIEAAAIVLADQNSGPYLDAFLLGFPVLAAAIALYVGVQPYVTLSRMVRRHLDEVISPLMAPAGSPSDALARAGSSEEDLKVYTYFGTLRTLPIRTAAIMQYVLGILASLIVYFLQQILA